MLGCLSDLSREFVRAPEHCDDFDRRTPVAVDDPVRSDDDFTNGGILTLWNHPSGFWKYGELFNASHDASHDQLGEVYGVAADIRQDPDDIVGRLR